MWPDPRTVANVRPLYSITYPATCRDIIGQIRHLSPNHVPRLASEASSVCLHCLYSRVFACVRTHLLVVGGPGAPVVCDGERELVNGLPRRGDRNHGVKVAAATHFATVYVSVRSQAELHAEEARRKEPEYPDADAAADDVLEVRQHRLGAVSEVEQVVPANGAPAPWLIRPSIRVDGRFHLGVVHVRLHEELGARISQVLRP
jgi:hypothetical protein